MRDLLVMRNVTRSFDGRLVLKDGRLELRQGEIHALIGANGAGKSTMMNILYGMLERDSGSIVLEGREVRFRNAAEAQKAGICMLHQELNVARDLTVAQNLFLGREPMKGLSVDDKAMTAACAKLLEAVGLKLDPTVKMGELSPGQQQLAVIASLLSRELKLLILDEPTTALGSEDVARLFALMRQFKERGIAMIFISHRLDELFAISDRITVMRDGCFVICSDTAKMTKEELVYHMTGRSVSIGAKRESAAAPDAPTALEVTGLSTAAYLRGISFSLKKGEILGITGLMGSGRTELARAVCGIDPISAGKIAVNGEAVRIASPMDAARYGLGYLSENRNEEGLITGKDIVFNTAVNSLDRYRRLRGLDDGAILEDAVRFNQRVGTVTASYDKQIETLSGGNRQKVIIARALMKDLQILIFDEPTRGIDVGAKEDIYGIIKGLARDGHSVIVISSETEEIQALCDRVLVMYEGRLSGELAAGEVLPERIMALAAGMGENGHEEKR